VGIAMVEHVGKTFNAENAEIAEFNTRFDGVAKRRARPKSDRGKNNPRVSLFLPRSDSVVQAGLLCRPAVESLALLNASSSAIFAISAFDVVSRSRQNTPCI
jgi:hypothetical protein